MRGVSSAGRRIAPLALALGALTLAPAAAVAEVTEVDLTGGVLSLKGSPLADEISVVAEGNTVLIDDPGGVPEAEAPCKAGTPSSVISCPRSQVDTVEADLGDAADVFDGDGDLRFEIIGGKDDDEIHGGDARDLLEGKLGGDVITGGAGGDDLLGGLDDDVLSGQGGGDTVDGGPGDDRGKGGGGKDHCAGIEAPKNDPCERNTKG
jgi:hypothetical protein